MSHDFEKELQELLEGLTEREQQALRERFGIGFDPNRAARTLAEQFEATRERIREIERRASSRPPNPDDDPPSAA